MEITQSKIKRYYTKTYRTCIRVSRIEYIKKKRKKPSKITTELNQILQIFFSHAFR